MADSVFQAQCLYGAGTVAAAYDTAGPFIGGLSHGKSNGFCTGVKAGKLEDAHRAVPDNRLCAEQLIGKQFSGVRADVHSLPVTVDVTADYFRGDIGLEFFGNNRIRGQYHFTTVVGSLLEHLGGFIEKSVFAEAFADITAVGLEEGISHRPAYQYAVNFLQQVLYDPHLVGDLCTAQDSNKWFLGIGEGLAEKPQLPFDQETGNARFTLHHQRDGVHRGIVPVGCAEGVIDIYISHGCELFCKIVLCLAQLGVLPGGLVLDGFLLVKTQVLQQHTHAGFKCIGPAFCFWADAVSGKDYFFRQ